MQATPGKGHPHPSRQPRVRLPRALPRIDNLRVWHKLALIPLVLLIPIAVLLYFFVDMQRSNIATTAKKVRGVEYIQAISPLLQSLAKHRGMTHSLLSGDPSFAQLRQQMAAEIDQQLQDLLKVDKKYGTELNTKQRVLELLQDWQQLKDYATALSAEDAWNTHNRFIERHLFPLVLEIGNNASLIVDAELDAHYLADLVINILPALTDDLGRLSGYGAGLIAKGRITADDKDQLQSTLTRARQVLGEASRVVESSFQANPSLQRKLEQLRYKFENGVAESIGIAQTQLLFVTKPTIQAGAYLQTTTQGINAAFEFYAASLDQLQQLLQNRMGRLQAALYSSLASAFLVLLAAGLLVWWLANQITRPIQHLHNASMQLARGNFDLRLQLRSRDELGDLASAFQHAAIQLKAYVDERQKEQQKALQLEQKVSRFLEVATEIARGDLTQRGEVSNDLIGNVIDAVNLTVEEIAHLLKEVKRAAESVNQSAAQMDQLTSSIAAGALSQAKEVSQVQQQTQVVTSSIRQMAESAGLTAQAAQKTLESAQQGRQAVTQTLSGMSDIRREMQAIAENIGVLAQRSAEIENITRVLEDFASQTNLLALNASFEAAGAGAAGRRFAIIAEEIRKLAEESARETNRVSLLVQQVQSDIARVVEQVQEGVREVETGYGVATGAGSRLEEIANLAAQSASLAQEISGLAQSQVSVVERVDQAVQKIAHTAQQTGNESQRGHQSAEAMRVLAQELSRNLGRFRLPD